MNSENTPSGATFLVQPSMSALVVGLPKNVVITTDFPSFLQQIISKLSAEDSDFLIRQPCNLICNPLICGGFST